MPSVNFYFFIRYYVLKKKKTGYSPAELNQKKLLLIWKS